MLTVTGRKHIIAAIRRAILCNFTVAADIVDRNWMMLASMDQCDLRLAEVQICSTNEKDFSGGLSLYVNKRWLAPLRAPAGALKRIATCSIEEAYAPRPNPALPQTIGVLSNARWHADAGRCVQFDLVSDIGTETFTVLPMDWHKDDDLLNYVVSYDGQQVRVIYQNAEDAVLPFEGLPEGVADDEPVAEFIIAHETCVSLPLAA